MRGRSRSRSDARSDVRSDAPSDAQSDVRPARRAPDPGPRAKTRAAGGRRSARRRRPPRPRPFGLRTRLVFAFLLVAAVGCGTTAALTYRAARTAILEQTQDTAVGSFRRQVATLSTSLPLNEKAMRAELLRIAAEGRPHPWRVYAEYDGVLRVSSTDRPGSSVLTPELRAHALASDTPHGSFQRVVRGGTPYLTIAVPAVFPAGHSYPAGRPTGVVLYAVMDLRVEDANIAAMVTAARDGALPALLVALVPALLASRSVLRPVRELRRAAHDMGEGRLDARIHAKGSDELADLARTFNQAAAELESSVAELRNAEARARRFASDVSHELRTPLAGMLAVTEVLDEDADTLDSDTARAVRLVSAETGKLAVLVEDLMEISRFDARAAELHTDEVDAAELVRKTLQNRHWVGPGAIGIGGVGPGVAGFGAQTGGGAWAGSHAGPGVGIGPGAGAGVAPGAVVTELTDGIRARLDPRRFDVVVANLVGNALRHGAAPVTVRVYEEAGALVTEVADRGPGIPGDVLPHVFDRFYKGDPARTRSAGSGLGLAITLENVRLHGGTVVAANRPDGGAVFTVRIPL